MSRVFMGFATSGETLFEARCGAKDFFDRLKRARDSSLALSNVSASLDRHAPARRLKGTISIWTPFPKESFAGKGSHGRLHAAFPRNANLFSRKSAPSGWPGSFFREKA